MISSGSEHICVVIGRTRHKMMQIEIQEAGKRGARLIELRLDFLAKAPQFKRLLDNKPCPMIATVRRPQDGGRWSGTEEARQAMLRQAIVSGFDWVDLETDIADRIPRFCSKSLNSGSALIAATVSSGTLTPSAVRIVFAITRCPSSPG